MTFETFERPTAATSECGLVCNACGKFLCESGDGSAALCHAALNGTVTPLFTSLKRAVTVTAKCTAQQITFFRTVFVHHYDKLFISVRYSIVVGC